MAANSPTVNCTRVLVYVDEALKELEGFACNLIHFDSGKLPIPSATAWQQSQAQM
jgi:hypothetical protein